MKTMFEILMTAPPDQVTRCKIAMVEIAHGHWEAAALTMEDAIYESEPGEWAVDCMEMENYLGHGQGEMPRNRRRGGRWNGQGDSRDYKTVVREVNAAFSFFA